MGLRPVPAALESPAIDNVADQVKVVTLAAAQELDKELSLAPSGAQMNIGNPDGPVPQLSADFGVHWLMSVLAFMPLGSVIHGIQSNEAIMTMRYGNFLMEL
jgi:hypothetical protein